MARLIPIGIQNFEKIRRNNMFYVDKTEFIEKWWHSQIDVTVITRPRRFGKTLMMATIERFFSPTCSNQKALFEGLDIWKHKGMRQLAGKVPTIFLTFSDAKHVCFKDAKKAFASKLVSVLSGFSYLQDSRNVPPGLKKRLREFNIDSDNVEIYEILRSLSEALLLHHGHKPIILVDEYDTILISAWTKNYWDEISDLLRGWMNATFKSNAFLDRALLTGITRVGKESLFSDFNNAMVVTVNTPAYETYFGFTEAEVQTALKEYGFDCGKEARKWYDGFVFGDIPGIYNPWSIVQYLQYRKAKCYWMNSSEDEIVEQEIRKSGKSIKTSLVTLLNGGKIESKVSDYVSFKDLQGGAVPIWSLLLAGGYIKAVGQKDDDVCELELTNYEVKVGFEAMISHWFDNKDETLDDFIQALLAGDTDAMTEYLQRISTDSFSFFDVKSHEPENFYHGFVLGMLVRLKNRYFITSNRESGLGRYDVMLEPKDKSDYAYVLEFKSRQPRKEKTLRETLANAQAQILSKQYSSELLKRGIPISRIRTYGVVFDGKQVLVG